MTVSVKTVKEAVKTTLAEDDRLLNFMMFGLEEAKEGEEDDLRMQYGLCLEHQTLSCGTGFAVCSAYRMGDRERKSDKTRPVKNPAYCCTSCPACFEGSPQTEKLRGGIPKRVPGARQDEGRAGCTF